LDYGYVRLIEAWGGGEDEDEDDREAGIIESARQSTQGSFRGWERDEKLLRYLYENKHSTPFEFSGMALEVRAPIFVFRQWHRHRTQSVNEASARYRPLPAEDYVPDADVLLKRAAHAAQAKNRQAGSEASVPPSSEQIEQWLEILELHYIWAESVYQRGLELGIPKEVARLALTVGRYSQMRVSANLRNWIGFLSLRLDPHAQWEIRQYAGAVAQIVAATFPRTWALTGFEEAP
jgi:thymidylate synthase (FAD)